MADPNPNYPELKTATTDNYSGGKRKRPTNRKKASAKKLDDIITNAMKGGASGIGGAGSGGAVGGGT